MQDLLDFISTTIPLDTTTKTLVQSSFTREEVKDKAIIIAAGPVVRSLYFLSSGFVKGYQLQEGKLVVDHLVERGNFFTSLDSFTNERPTVETFQAVGAVRLYKITKVALEHLNKEIPAFQVLNNQIKDSALACKMERIQDFQTLTAKERYLKLLRHSPALVQHFSVQDLAAYLGIEAPSLSRIRKAIIN